MADPSRFDYLLECYRSAREELLFRVGHRDSWLKLQLLAQVTLLALAGGVKIGGVEAAGPLPPVLALAIPVSFVLALLYTVEDRLIGHLATYIGNLSQEEMRLSEASFIILNSEVSAEMREYRRRTLPIRGLAQAGAFVLIPAGLFIYRTIGFGVWQRREIIEVALEALIWIFTVVILLRSYRLRQLTAERESPAAPVGPNESLQPTGARQSSR